MPFASEKTIAREKLAQIIAEGKEEEVRCRFCNRAYRFSPGELTALL
ncbi:MAG: Hsp33 family molecular chaperone HslO [Lachnospiraceae bacterium]|nr:Hsp33 family molecular chaperone HslO [Lachnospiraceae bacterium]